MLCCERPGRFASAVSPPAELAAAVTTCECVNTFPVLATPEDDAVLGAAICLPDHPEIAIVGRSNVGKSSLINALVGEDRLARTSRTPGRTRLINWFQVDSQRPFHCSFRYWQVS